MTARRRIDVAQRRARLVARHHLGRTAATVEEAVRSVVAVHSSDPITPYLALAARVPGFTVADLDRSLYEERSLWRLHAMRRTLFVVEAHDAAVVLAAASRDVARAERRKLEQLVAAARGGAADDGWLRRVERATADALADGQPRRTAELTALVDDLALPLSVGSGRWAAQVPLATRLLVVLALDGRVVRAQPAGSWLSSQYRWADRRAWFGDRVQPDALDVDPAAARADLVRRYLQSHGPATATDVQWWTGWGARAVDAALSACGAVVVDLDDGGHGMVLPDDVEEPAPPPVGVALLPGLDPTVMGWKERGWYLGADADRLFDRNGNAGPTVWLDGRVVGGWAVTGAGEVVVRLLEDVGVEAAAVEAEAAGLTGWLAGMAPTPRFRTPLERDLAAGG